MRSAIFPRDPALNLCQRWKNTKITLDLLVVLGKNFFLNFILVIMNANYKASKFTISYRVYA